MDKAEIIRKISKKAGVPDSEAKKFFEIFLKDASDILKPGESLYIDGVGAFQLRVGQIENRSSQNPDKEYIYSDLIVYADKDEDLSEEVIFNVPSGVEKEYQPVDSYFSLSIGKPVIPLKGVRETEFFIPPSGTELRSLLESKIARLISEAEKKEGGKETETIRHQSDEEGSGTQKERMDDSEEEPVEIELPSRSDFLKTREFENLSWDFGENLFDEIEEGSVTDKENEIEETLPENQVTTSKSIENAAEKVKPEFEDETSEEVQEEDIFEEIIDEETDENVYFEGEEEEPQQDAAVEPYQKEELPEEAESDTIELTEPENKEEESGSYVQESKFPVEEPIKKEEEVAESEQPGTEPEEPQLKNFQRVRSLTREFTTTEFDDTEETEESRPRKVTEVRGGYQKVRRTTAEFNFDLSGIKGLDEIDEEPPAKVSSRLRDYQGYRKRSSIPTFIIAFIVVLALAGIIFLYLKLKSSNNDIAGENNTSKTGQTTTIERNYDVPVNYPYDKSGENKPADNGTVENQQGKTEPESKTEINNGTSQADQPEIREPVNAQRIGNYIYQYPEGVVVQVSSWKSKTIALNQVQKYRKAGYTAFAERSEIAGMGLYYRVRVGYFKSLAEAENFVK